MPATLDFYGISSDWYDTDNWSNGQIPGATDDVSISNAINLAVTSLRIQSTESISVRQMWITSPNFTLTVDGHLSVEQLTLNNTTLNGSGDVDIFVSLAASAGTMNGTGITRSYTSAQFNAMPTFADSRTFVNLGSADFNNNFSLATTASIVNQGTLTLREVTMTYSPTTPITNNGTLILDGGTIHFTGTNTIANTVEFRAGRFFVDGTLTIPTLTHSYGFIDGPGSLEVTTAFTWLPGAVQVGTGSTTISATGKLILPRSTSSARMLAGRTLQVYGTREFPPTMEAGEPVFISVGHVTEDPNHVAEQAFGNGNVKATAPIAPPGPLSVEGEVMLAGEIYDALYGGLFGAGVDQVRVYRALEGRSLIEVNNIRAAYAIRYKHTDGTPRDMVVDLNSQWGISFSTFATQKLSQLLAGNQAGAVAVSIRDALEAAIGVEIYYRIGLEHFEYVRKLLYSSNAPSVELEYALLYPSSMQLNVTSGPAPSVTVFPTRLQYDLESTLRIVHSMPLTPSATVGTIVNDHRKSVEMIFAGNLAASDAYLIHAIRTTLDHESEESSGKEFLAVLGNKNQAYLAIVASEYLTLFGMVMIDDLQPILSGFGKDALDALLKGNRFDVLATRLRAAFDQDGDGSTADWDGTDEDAVWKVFDGLYSDERAMLAQQYFKRYQVTITREIISEFTNNMFDGPELDQTLKLYRNGGLSVAERIYYATEGFGTDEPAIRRAMAELRTMTPAQIAAAHAEYGALAGFRVPVRDEDGSLIEYRTQTLADAFNGDLSGGFRDNAMASLAGQITTVEQYYRLAERRYNYERGGGAANWLGNFLSGMNTQGENLERSWAEIQKEYAAITNKNDAITGHVNFRQLVARIDQDVEAYRGFRSASANLVANGVATVAGMAAFALTGGTIAPIIVAIAAGAAAQPVTRSLVEGYFTWEELPADCLVGGIGGLIGGLTLPSAAALLPAGTRLGVLRATAANPFVGGAFTTGLTSALESDTWSQGFAVGMFNVAGATTVGGLGAWMLARVPGATVNLANATGATALTRSFVSGTSRLVVSVVDSEFLAAVRTLASAVNGTVRNAIEETFTTATIDAIANSIVTNATQGINAIRNGIQTALSGMSGPRLQFAANSGDGMFEGWLPEFGAFTFANVRGQLLTSMQSVYMTLRDVVDVVRARISTPAVPISRELGEAVTAQLPALSNADDAAIHAMLTSVLPPGTTIDPAMVTRFRRWVNPTRDAVVALADSYRSQVDSGGPLCVAILDTVVGPFDGRSGFPGVAHQVVLDVLGSIQPVLRSGAHGNCAEVHAISQALRAAEVRLGHVITTYAEAQQELAGSFIQTARVRTSVAHGTPMPACDSCIPLLEAFGIALR